MFIYFIHFVTVEGNFFPASMIGDFRLYVVVFFMTFVVSKFIFSRFRQFSFHSWWWLCAIVVNQWFIYSILHFYFHIKKMYFFGSTKWVYFFMCVQFTAVINRASLKFLDLKFKNKIFFVSKQKKKVVKPTKSSWWSAFCIYVLKKKCKKNLHPQWSSF